MAVAKCPRCGAVVTAQLIGGELKVSQGASFLSTCTQIKDRLAAGQVCVATECDVMEIASDAVPGLLMRRTCVKRPQPQIEPQGRYSRRRLSPASRQGAKHYVK